MRRARVAWLLLAAIAGLRAAPARAQAPPAAVATADALVLVVSAASPVTSLDAIDVKRLFLGIPVSAGNGNLHALLNFSDQRLRGLFYQHVVGMTEGMYERRTLALTLEQGRRAPAVVPDGPGLLARVTADPLAVSFAWRSQLAGHPGLRAVRELWRE